jgi:hypothetical protein
MYEVGLGSVAAGAAIGVFMWALFGYVVVRFR